MSAAYGTTGGIRLVPMRGMRDVTTPQPARAAAATTVTAAVAASLTNLTSRPIVRS